MYGLFYHIPCITTKTRSKLMATDDSVLLSYTPDGSICCNTCVVHLRPPQFGGTAGNRGSVIAPFERASVVSYRLSIVTIVLSLTIRLQFAIECLQYTSQHGQNLGRKGWTDVDQIFNTIWEKSRQCLQLFEHNAET